MNPLIFTPRFGQRDPYLNPRGYFDNRSGYADWVKEIQAENRTRPDGTSAARAVAKQPEQPKNGDQFERKKQMIN